MQIIENPITIAALTLMAEAGFGEMIKAVVDVDLQLISIDAELHADLEAQLLENGSSQASLWGINYYPEIEDEDFIEYDSMINIRPAQGNRSRGVEDESIRRKIVAITNKWIIR